MRALSIGFFLGLCCDVFAGSCGEPLDYPTHSYGWKEISVAVAVALLAVGVMVWVGQRRKR